MCFHHVVALQMANFAIGREGVLANHVPFDDHFQYVLGCDFKW